MAASTRPAWAAASPGRQASTHPVAAARFPQWNPVAPRGFRNICVGTEFAVSHMGRYVLASNMC